MNFSAPTSFDAALAAAQARSLLPTTGTTDMLQKLKPAIKRRALWSATVDFIDPLQKLDDITKSILEGKTNRAEGRLEMKLLWRALGYEPDAADAGTLRDLASDKRINLQIDTLTGTARGYGHYATSRRPSMLDEYPAQELFRAEDRKDERDWNQRWMMAGGQFYNMGRMIALKTDPVWERLGDSRMFPDALDNPYPPFAFNSGMNVLDISRDEAVALGLIDADEQLEPGTMEDFNADLKCSPGELSANLRAAIEVTVRGTFDANGVLHFNQEGNP